MSEKAKLLFRTDANRNIGWGHFYRSFSLAQMLSPFFRIEFAMIQPGDAILDIIANEGFHYTAVNAPSRKSFLDDFENEMTFDLGTDHCADIVILDGYGFKESYQKAVYQVANACAIIEDQGSGIYAADLIINPAPGIKPQDYQLSKPQTKFALGPDFALVRPEFLENRHNQNQEYLPMNRAFVCFGGADSSFKSTIVTQLLLEHSEMDILVVLPPDSPQLKTLKSLAEITDRVIIKQGLHALEMSQAMCNSSIAVVPASGLLVECLAVGLPVIAGCTAENQKKNYHGYLSLNAFVDAKEFSDQEFVAALNEFSNKRLTSPIDKQSPHRLRKLFQQILIESN